MNYSEAQLKRLRYLLMDEWVTDDPVETDNNLAAALAAIESSEELHQFAGAMNWDGTDPEFWGKIIDHPLCDRGTALMIYCLAGPGFLYRKQTKGTAFLPFEAPMFEFLKSIERRFENGYYSCSTIRFDPHNARGRDLMKENQPGQPDRGNQYVPAFMKVATEGRDIEFIDWAA